MKKLFYLWFFIAFHTYAQLDVTIELKDNSQITDIVKTRNGKLKSVTSKRKYSLEQINRIYVKTKSKTDTFYVLNTKDFYHQKYAAGAFGYKILSLVDLELYNCHFSSLESFIKTDKTYKKRRFLYIRRKGDEFVYNIARIIDGKGPVKYKKRLKDFFYDCPEVIDKVDQYDELQLDIVDLMQTYSKFCSKKPVN